MSNQCFFQYVTLHGVAKHHRAVNLLSYIVKLVETGFTGFTEYCSKSSPAHEKDQSPEIITTITGSRFLMKGSYLLAIPATPSSRLKVLGLFKRNTNSDLRALKQIV